MTKEVYEKLVEFDRPLQCAYRAHYASISTYDFKRMLEIYYGPDWQHKTSRSVLTCGHCKLQELQKIGKEYFDFEQKENERNGQAS